MKATAYEITTNMVRNQKEMNLDVYEFRVLLTIADKLNYRTIRTVNGKTDVVPCDTLRCWWSQEKLADECGISKRKIVSVVQSLQEKGLIKVHTNIARTHKHNIYEYTGPLPKGDKDVRPEAPLDTPY